MVEFLLWPNFWLCDKQMDLLTFNRGGGEAIAQGEANNANQGSLVGNPLMWWSSVEKSEAGCFSHLVLH